MILTEVEKGFRIWVPCSWPREHRSGIFAARYEGKIWWATLEGNHLGVSLWYLVLCSLSRMGKQEKRGIMT